MHPGLKTWINIPRLLLSLSGMDRKYSEKLNHLIVLLSTLRILTCWYALLVIFALWTTKSDCMPFGGCKAVWQHTVAAQIQVLDVKPLDWEDKHLVFGKVRDRVVKNPHRISTDPSELLPPWLGLDQGTGMSTVKSNLSKGARFWSRISIYLDSVRQHI